MQFDFTAEMHSDSIARTRYALTNRAGWLSDALSRGFQQSFVAASPQLQDGPTRRETRAYPHISDPTDPVTGRAGA